jgi:hypothetical protein
LGEFEAEEEERGCDPKETRAASTSVSSPGALFFFSALPFALLLLLLLVLLVLLVLPG